MKKSKFSSRGAVKYIPTSVSLPQEAHDALYRLYDKRPYASRSQIVTDALIFADMNDMYDHERFYKINHQTSTPSIPRAQTKARTVKVDGVKVSKSKLVENKREWAEKYGATVDGSGFCTYTIYEVVPTGDVIKLDRGEHIDAMPDSEDGWKEMILGNFTNITQAEAAVSRSRKEEPEERVIKADKK